VGHDSFIRRGAEYSGMVRRGAVFWESFIVKLNLMIILRILKIV
jgi:hypothetical protein